MTTMARVFEVDQAKRRIVGLAVPYNEPTHVAGMDGVYSQFAQGSIRIPADPTRVKLRVSHKPGTDIGYAVTLTEDARGLWATFSVGRGADGDQALQKAADKVWDGLSIGLRDGARHETRRGIRHFLSAELAEISLTPDPAFGSARVAAVAMQAAKGTTMTSPYVFDTVTGRFSAGRHDFSTDLIAASRGDQTAQRRAIEFLQQQFAVISSDVTAIIPNGHRPDAYADQRGRTYPLWTATGRGVLDNTAPFTIPKFGTEADLIDDHTEGETPEDGTFTVTGQLVEPTLMSGICKITREVWDAGGSPRVSDLIYNRMLAGYLEAIERSVPTALAAAAGSITNIDLTAGAADETLVDQILDHLAALQFVNGASQFTLTALHVDLYRKLAAAKGTDGHKLLKTLGPVNTPGQVGQTLDLGGLPGVPHWALGPAAETTSNSWLIDPAAVASWASTPQRLEFHTEVSNVYLGIWGYRAAAVTDPAGVRQITYSPTAP